MVPGGSVTRRPVVSTTEIVVLGPLASEEPVAVATLDGTDDSMHVLVVGHHEIPGPPEGRSVVDDQTLSAGFDGDDLGAE